MMFTPHGRDITYLVLALGCSGLGAFFDIKTRKIPNLLTGYSFLLGLFLHILLDGSRGIPDALFGGLACGLIFVIFYLAGGMGAGDVKLVAAVGCIAGLSHTAYLLVFTSLAGGVMAVILTVMRGRIKQTVANVYVLTVHHMRRGITPHEDLNVLNGKLLRLPYGVAIAAGSLVTLYLYILQRVAQ